MERWANKPVEFHFATILSPWIRRALIAGGFGIGQPSSRAPTEIAPVVPYRGGRRQLDERHKLSDIEAIDEIPKEEEVPIIPEDTPFFHFDLVAAVRAAESGLGLDRSESYSPSLVKSPAVKTSVV